MTDAPRPVAVWKDGALRGQDGAEVTDAQRAKAARYVKDGKIFRIGHPVLDAPGFGLPYKVIERYRLEPIPGCRQQRVVQVVAWYGPDDTIRSLDFSCDCQKAAGSKSASPGCCSHALAVHDWRRAQRQAPAETATLTETSAP